MSDLDSELSCYSSQTSTSNPLARLTNSIQILKGKEKSRSRNDKTRERALDSVHSLLRDTGHGSVQEVLDRNSSDINNKNLFTWDVLFTEITAFFEAEIVKLKRLKFPDDKIQSLFGLVHLIVRQANKVVPYLKKTSLYEFLKARFADRAALPVVAAGFANLLKDFLLRQYNCFLESSQWEELLGMGLEMYKNTAFETNRDAVLDILNGIIPFASDCPSLLPVLRNKMIPFFRTNLMNATSSAKLIDGAILLCRLNAAEFRSALCKLGEDTIHDMLPNDLKQLELTSKAGEGKVKLIEYILVQIKLHHPYDVGFSSPAFYANDIPRWISLVRSIFSFCCEIIEHLVKRKTDGYLQDILPPELLLLATKVSKHVADSDCDDQEPDEDSVEGPSSKRRMVYRTFQSVVLDVVRLPTSKQLIWIQYIRRVVEAFPDMTELRTLFTSLLQMGDSLLHSNFIIQEEIFEYWLTLLRYENYLISVDPSQERYQGWNEIWNMTIKSVRSNDAKLGALELLRELMLFVQPPNISSLLQLFVNGTLTLCEASLQLLSEYLRCCSLPQVMTDVRVGTSYQDSSGTACPRIALIGWILTSKTEAPSLPEKQLAAILCSLLVKRSHIFMDSMYPDQNAFLISKPFVIEQEQFEDMVLMSSFVCSPRTTINFKTSITSGDKVAFIVQQEVGTFLINLFHENLDITRFQTTGKQVDLIRKISMIQNRITILLNIINLLHKSNIGKSEGIGSWLRMKFEEILLKTITDYKNLIAEFVGLNCHNVENIYSLVKLGKSVLETGHLCDEAKTVLANNYPKELLELYKRVFRSVLSRYVQGTNASLIMPYVQTDQAEGNDLYVLNERILLENSSFEALGCLLQYGLVCREKDRFIHAIINDLSEESFIKDSVFTFLFELCAEAVHRVIPILREYRTLDLCIFELLQKMCNSFFRNSKCVKELWEIFYELTPVVAKVQMESEEIETERPKRRLMSLVGPLSIYIGNSGIEVSKSAFRMLALLAENDPALRWSGYTNRAKEYEWILLNLSQQLTNPSHQVRMLVAGTIYEMFKASLVLTNEFPMETIQESIVKRKSSYESFYTSLFKAYDVPEGLKDEAVLDEALNRTTLILWSLTKVMFSYLVEQRRVLFSLCMVMQMKKIGVHLANRALRCANTDASKTTIARVSYILGKWFKMNFPLDSFPTEFFDCSNIVQFEQRFYKDIVVQYFEQNNIEALTSFAKSIRRTTEQLVTECYGVIMGRVTPSLAFLQKSSEANIPRHIIQANDAHKRLILLLGGKSKIEALMQQNLGDVVMNILSLAYDAKITEAWGCTEIRLAEPEPPFYEECNIRQGLEFLKQSSPHREVTIIGYLLQTAPKSIYKILMSLLVSIHEAHNDLEKFWRLHHFTIFIDLVLSEPTEVLKKMKTFLCQFIVHSYLRFFVTDNDVRFVKSVLHLFLNCSKCLLLKCSDEVVYHFRFIVGRLRSTALPRFPSLKQKIREVLELFLKVDNEMFSQCIASLDPFSESESSFEEFRQLHSRKKYGEPHEDWPLARELLSCLADLDNTKDSVTKEKLIFLRELLSTRKNELKKLVQALDGKRFLEECTDNPFHCILRLLVGIAKHGTDHEIVLEACRCLGEIGPVDLSILVLPPFGRTSKVVSMINAIPSIIELTASYLTSDDFQTSAVTGEVLQSLLEVTECSDVVNSEIKNRNTRLFSTLIPFVSENPNAKSTGKVNTAILDSRLKLLASKEDQDYSTWIANLTCNLIESIQPEGLAARIVPLCKLKVEFCEDILPFVVYYVLYSGRNNPQVRTLISEYFQHLLDNFTSVTKQDTVHHSSISTSNSEQYIYQNKSALRCILRVVQFLREHTAPQEIKNVRLTPWDNNFWLGVSYLDLAKSAQYCGAQLTAILYAEIYATSCDEKTTELSPNDEFYSQETTSFPVSRNKAEQIEKILLTAFASIGEQDAMYGCGYSRLYDFDSNLQYLQQMKKWDRSLFMYDSESSSFHGVCQSMKELGLHETLWTYMQGIGASAEADSDLSEIQFECAWRLAKWDFNNCKATYMKELPLHDEKHLVKKNRQKFLFLTAQTALAEDTVTHLESLKNGYKAVVEELRHASLESSVNLYGFLSSIQSLHTIEEYFNQHQAQRSMEELMSKWKLQDELGFTDFQFQEPVLCLRNILLSAHKEKFPSREIDKIYDESTYQVVCKARAAGRLELAEKYATKLLETVDKIRKQLEIARNHNARGEKDIACHLLKRVLLKTNPEQYTAFPSLLLFYGEWLFETMTERPAVILDKILGAACHIYDTKRSMYKIEDVAKAHFTLAKYADAQYQNICNYVKSDLFNEKVKQLQRAKEEQLIVDTIRKENTSNEDVRRTESVLRKQSNIDQREMNATYSEKKNLLVMALRQYVKGLSCSNTQDLLIFRAIGLWLERADEPEDEVTKEATKVIFDANLPSFKFVMVLHQLSARMGTANNSVNHVINNILVRCAVDHPYHALPVLLTQAFLHKDREFTRGSQKRQPEMNVQDRVQAAHKIILGLKKKEPLSALIKKMELLWLALIQLANLQEAVKNVENVERPIPENAALKKLIGMEDVPVPISVVPVNRSGSGSRALENIGIQAFEPKYRLVGGINSPKRITCLGTNGQRYNMLLKGHDDLRQDALMQQVFGVMNKLLQLEPRTKVRRLQVRTYKVVPLSQRSGVIEWCENTQTFGEYLVGSTKDGGAHALYRPQDLRPADCRKRMTEVKDCGDNSKKLQVFGEIIDKFDPVFRHFFFENFKSAGTYFERRLAYTRSVATSSMVGYILGLGDRHVLNILVDKTTAEFIHIDLGVAFEQGKLLPTPELIPFRLTRDVVDGMGVAAIEGVFRRSSEITLEVLRQNSEIILTILAVLLYDPLYVWTLTSDRMQKVQPVDKGLPKRVSLQGEVDITVPKERNNSAARVLLRLRQKLLGIEEGGTSGSSFSIPGHVSFLIQIATNPDLLSRLFPGWQPYL